MGRHSTYGRKRDIMALSHGQLVKLVWTLTKAADDSAKYHADTGDFFGRDGCVMTPGEVLEYVEEATDRGFDPSGITYR